MHAALAVRDGDREAAAREYAAILPELAEMGLVYKQALVVLDMALVLGPDDPVVRASVDDARAILERLGARAFSARLDELMGEAADSRSARFVGSARRRSRRRHQAGFRSGPTTRAPIGRARAARSVTRCLCVTTSWSSARD